MATRSFEVVRHTFEASGVIMVRWTNLLNGDDGQPFPCPHYSDKSVQVTGTFGTGGTIIAEGSNILDSPTYATLRDPLGNNISLTSAGIKQVMENSYWIRPRVTAGDGTTNLTVTVILHTTR